MDRNTRSFSLEVILSLPLSFPTKLSEPPSDSGQAEAMRGGSQGSGGISHTYDVVRGHTLTLPAT